MKITKVAVVSHTEKSNARELDRKLRAELARRGARVVVASKAELMLVLGGDGTMLSAVPDALAHDIPIIGINMGRLGFLTELATPGDLWRALPKLLAGKFYTDSRALLDVTALGRSRERRLGSALNEVLLMRERLAHIPDLKIRAAGETSGPYGLDGMIIATATGSTGHALAAGGPVLYPNVGGIVLVPLCPHPYRARPVVCPETEVELVLNPRNGPYLLNIDGWRKTRLRAGETILRVAPARRRVRFARLSRRRPFLEIIRRKLV